MQGITNIKIVEVIRTETVVGTGTEEDPVRTEVQYWDRKGTLICSKNQVEDNSACALE